MKRYWIVLHRTRSNRLCTKLFREHPKAFLFLQAKQKENVICELCPLDTYLIDRKENKL